MYASGQSDFLQTLTTRKAIARNHAKTMPRYHHFFQRFAVVESTFAQRFHTFWYHKFLQSRLVESKIANVLHRRRQPQRFQRTTPAKRCPLDEFGFIAMESDRLQVAATRKTASGNGADFSVWQVNSGHVAILESAFSKTAHMKAVKAHIYVVGNV